MKTRIYVVEDHPIMREMIVTYMEDVADMEVCGTAEAAEVALEGIPEATPDLVLVDVSMPGMDGIELTRRLQATFPEMRVLILSGHEEDVYAERALHAGSRGYVTKGDPDILLYAISRVMAGDIYLSESVREKLVL